MSDLMIFEIKHDAMTPSLKTEFKRVAKYYARFKKHSLIFLLDNNSSNIDNEIKFDFHEVIIEKHLLNEFAKNRLFNNLVDNFPELIITMLDCADNSYLIKVRKRDVERTK